MSKWRELGAADAAKECARSLAEDSWCIDYSGSKPIAFHSRSNREACTEALSQEFYRWRYRTATKVEMTDEERRQLPYLLISLLPHTYGSTFQPDAEHFVKVDGLLLVNTWVAYTPSEVVDAEGQALVDEFFERLFPDASERNTVRQFLAHAIQKPRERPEWGLLLTGEGGTGKSLLLQLAERSLGNRHWWREDDFKLIGIRFNEVLPDNILVTFDDATATSGTYGDLKHAMTRKSQQVEIKGKQRPVKREVFARISVLSNEEQPLPGMKDDRRFFAPQRCVHPVDRTESGLFFERFCAWLANSSSSAFLHHYFCRVDLTGFDPSKTIRTKTLRKMEGEEDSAQLQEVISTLAGDLRVFHDVEVAHHLKRRGMLARPDQISKALRDVGFECRRRLNPFHGPKQLNLWCSARQKRTPSLTPEQEQRIGAALSRSK